MSREFSDFNDLIAAHHMLPEGCTVLCAVSGGADSICLLHRLNGLRMVRHFTLIAAHYNHHLRGAESDRDEAFVRRFVAERCGEQKVITPEGERLLPPVEMIVGGGDVAAQAKERRAGLEETARAMRYDFLNETADRIGADFIATAHTADDNAETLLLHLLRGSGLRGLTGIQPIRGRLIRPLLTTTRQTVEQYLTRYGIPHVEDSSNGEDAFLRNRLRHQVMPLLEELAPGFTERSRETLTTLRADEDYLIAKADKLAAQAVPQDGGLVILASVIAFAPDPLAVRAVRRLIGTVSGGDRDCGSAHLEAVVRLCRGSDPSAQVSLPWGLIAQRVYDNLVIAPLALPTAPQPVPLALEGETVYGETGWTVTCRRTVCPETPPAGAHRFYLACEKVKGALFLRPRQTGDVLRLSGKGARTLKKLMIDRKIPRLRRALLPVLADDAGAVAAAELGPDTARLAAPGEAAFEIKWRECEKNGNPS